MIVTIDPRGARGIDGEVWDLGALRIAFTPRGVVVEIAADHLAHLVTAFARSGIALTGTDGTIDEGAPLVPAVARTLGPLGGLPVRCDVVSLRQVSVAQATRSLHRRPRLPRRSSPHDTARCRAILREEEHVLAWRRIVWAEPSVLRHRRGGIRPIVFDHDALHRSAERWIFASDGQVERWLTQ